MDYIDFDGRLADLKMMALDRAIALLWFGKHMHGIESMGAKELCELMHQCGHAKQNVSRLEDRLRADRRTVRHGDAGWRIRPQSIPTLDAAYLPFVDIAPPRKPLSTEIVPSELFSGTGRGYLTGVVYQINASYAHGLYDCTSVMCRRLLETLIIEAYEKLGRADEIKKSGTTFFKTFEDLIGYISADKSLHLSRDSGKVLLAVKALGDQSAHNRKFTARKGDIDSHKMGIRIAAEELMHLAGLQT